MWTPHCTSRARDIVRLASPPHSLSLSLDSFTTTSRIGPLQHTRLHKNLELNRIPHTGLSQLESLSLFAQRLE